MDFTPDTFNGFCKPKKIESGYVQYIYFYNLTAKFIIYFYFYKKVDILFVFSNTALVI